MLSVAVFPLPRTQYAPKVAKETGQGTLRNAIWSRTRMGQNRDSPLIILVLTSPPREEKAATLRSCYDSPPPAPQLSPGAAAILSQQRPTRWAPKL